MGLLPGSQDPDEQWVANDYAQKARFHDKIQDARKANPGTLNPSAFCLASGPTYLGMRGIFYTALPYGSDSANIQAVINMPAYWQRVYYKKDGLKELGKQLGVDLLNVDDAKTEVSAVAPSRPSSAPCKRADKTDKAAEKRKASPTRSVLSSSSVASGVLKRALRPSSAPTKRPAETSQVSASMPQLDASKTNQTKQTSAASDVGSDIKRAEKCTESVTQAVDAKKSKKRPSSAPMKRSASSDVGSCASADSKTSSLESYLKQKRKSSSSSVSSAPGFGLDAIRKSMHPIVMTAGKPKLCGKLGYGDQFNFHNTLAGQKYSVKAGSGPRTFDYDKLGHRSSKHELAFMTSLRYRMDLDCVLDAEKVISQRIGL